MGIIETRRLAAALAAIMLTTSVEAHAQSYFMRQKMAGVRSVPDGASTYDGKWSSGAWANSGSCIGTTQPQTRTVTCSGSSCDPALKPTTTNTATCTKTLSCGANMLEGGSFNNQTIIAQTPRKASRDLDLAWCETFAGATGCQATSTITYVIRNQSGQYVSSPYDAARWSATCSKPA